MNFFKLSQIVQVLYDQKDKSSKKKTQHRIVYCAYQLVAMNFMARFLYWMNYLNPTERRVIRKYDHFAYFTLALMQNDRLIVLATLSIQFFIVHLFYHTYYELPKYFPYLIDDQHTIAVTVDHNNESLRAIFSFEGIKKIFKIFQRFWYPETDSNVGELRRIFEKTFFEAPKRIIIKTNLSLTKRNIDKMIFAYKECEIVLEAVNYIICKFHRL